MSTLDTWIRSKNMTSITFAKLVGCSRLTIWKAKRGIAISPKFARKITEITGCHVLECNSPGIGRWI